MTKVELIALIDSRPGNFVPVFVVLKEDRYETLFGDGYYGYFLEAFFTRAQACTYVANFVPEQFICYHIKEGELTLDDGAIKFTGQLAQTDSASEEQVVGALLQKDHGGEVF